MCYISYVGPNLMTARSSLSCARILNQDRYVVMAAGGYSLMMPGPFQDTTVVVNMLQSNCLPKNVY
jgi:hypothetical protein